MRRHFLPAHHTYRGEFASRIVSSDQGIGDRGIAAARGKSIRQNKTGGERPGGDSTSRGGWGYYRKPAGCESSYCSSNPAHRRGHIYMGYHTRRNGVNANRERRAKIPAGKTFTTGDCEHFLSSKAKRPPAARAKSCRCNIKAGARRDGGPGPRGLFGRGRGPSRAFEGPAGPAVGLYGAARSLRCSRWRRSPAGLAARH